MKKFFTCCLLSLLTIAAMAGVRTTHYNYEGWMEKWTLEGDFSDDSYDWEVVYSVRWTPYGTVYGEEWGVPNSGYAYILSDWDKFFYKEAKDITLVSTEEFSDVTEVFVNAIQWLENASITLKEVKVGNEVFTPTDITIVGTAPELLFTGSGDGKIAITFSIKSRDTEPLVLYGISVTHDAPNVARNLAYSAAEATAVLGEEFAAPVLSGATQNVEYTSSNPYIAMVKRDGTVVPLASGETVITARGPEDNMYHAEEASYNLTVKYTSTTEGTSDTVQVDEAGGLRLAIADLESTRIRDLTIRGQLNGADLKYLNESSGRLSNLESLDLSEVVLVPSDDAYATFTIKVSGFVNSAGYYTCYIADSTYTQNLGSDLNGLGGANGYYNCYGKGLTGMFYGSKLKRIVLPNDTKEIGMYAFYGSEKLVEIVIPNGVCRVDECAFSSCMSLTSIVMPEAVTELSKSMFSGCSALANVGDLSNITRLGESAFAGCALVGDAKDMRLKLNSLDTIPNEAFGGCDELVDIVFSDNLQYVGEYAFQRCEKLASLSFPNTLKNIEAGAFYGCSSLEMFNCPTALENVSRSSFDSTPWMDNLIKNGNNEILYLGNIALAGIFDESYTNIELSFREGTIAIADGFRCYIDCGYVNSSLGNNQRIKKIVLPSSLRRIGDYAFGTELNGLEYNANITEITLPEGLEEIGDYAFSRCELLGAVKFPASLKHIGTHAFAYCKSISTLDLPSNIETIGTYAFRNNESLARVRYDVPDAKGNSLFFITTTNGCTADKVIIGPNVKVLPQNVFSYASNLIKVEFEERDSTSYLYVGDYAFSGCKTLTQIKLPVSTDSIGEYAFSNCSALKDIELPNGLKKIGYCAFSDCKALTTIALPEGLSYIGGYAFAYNDSFTAITFPESLQYLGYRAFYYTPLKSVVWNPIYCTTERGSASIFGSSITSLEIGDKVENIPSGFCANLSIVSIDLPASVKNIDEFAFYGCYSLNQINLYSTTPPTFIANNYTFSNYNAEVHIPQGTLADYQATDWNKFNLIEDLPGTAIENVASEGVSISVREGVLHINGHRDDYCIYNMEGKLVYEGTAATLSLPSGGYVVKIGDKVYKILL